MRVLFAVLLLIASASATRTLVFHKPAGLVTTHNDELGRRTVYDALRERLPPNDAGESWHACGRLDADTTGLLIITTDGRLVRHVTDPTAGGNLMKKYRALCHRLDRPAIRKLQEGVDLGGGLGVSRPASVAEDDEQPNGKQSLLTIGIREGRNRQIRRMLHAVGSGVMRLERLSVGSIELGDLPEGEYRWLSEEELRDGLGYPPPSEEAADEATATDYSLLDSGDFSRLEYFGGHLVARPCPSASWKRGLSEARWRDPAVLRYTEEDGGDWVDADAASPSWSMDTGLGFTLGLQCGPSGQVGAFPEQHDNWRWLKETCETAIGARRSGGGPLRILNLFGHTGASSLACAAAAAAAATDAPDGEGPIEIVHLDGARSAVSRARSNADLSDLSDVPVRWICEDVMTYCNRAAKRGETFDGIIVDPPAFGRGGKKGAEWRIQRDMPNLLDVLATLLPDRPAFVLLTCHDQRWPSSRLSEALEGMLPCDDGSLEEGRMVLKASERGGRDLPMGAFARWRRG